MITQATNGQLAKVYAVLGNALLSAPTTPAPPYLDSAFWASFPSEISNEQALAGLQRVRAYIEATRVNCADGGCEKTALEFTQLFIGPPAPVAAPWESLNKGDDEAVGYGKPAFEMTALLAGKGLEVSHENNQYPDHLGIELLFLSYLCEQLATQVDEQGAPTGATTEEALAFIEQHPLAWVCALRTKVQAVYPEGFYVGVLLMVEGTLQWHRDALICATSA